MLIGFILAERIEALSLQMSNLYTVDMLLDRPLFLTLIVCAFAMFVWGVFFNRNKLDYT